MQAAHAHAARLTARPSDKGLVSAVGVKTPAPAFSHSCCLEVLVPTLLLLLISIDSAIDAMRVSY